MKAPRLSLRAGSVASRVLDHLHTCAPGTTLSRAEISVLFNAVPGNVSTLLSKAVEAGALAITTEGKTRYYHLPADVEPQAEEEPGALAITTDSTGDLWFSGARVTTEGDVLLSSEQLQQLVAFATSPAVDRAAAFKLEPQS